MQAVFQEEPSHLESEVCGLFHGCCEPVSSSEPQGWALEAGSLHWNGKGIVVAKVISGHGSRWLQVKVLEEACGEANQEG